MAIAAVRASWHFATRAHGSLFVGNVESNVPFRSVIRDYSEHLTTVLSERAQTEIRAYLPTQYMYLGHNGGDPKHNPVPKNAGALEASVHEERVTTDWVRVTTDPVIYGPWIEGVSWGNFVIWPGRVKRGLPGRFPGYHAFRREAQELNVVAENIANVEFQPYLAQLNA